MDENYFTTLKDFSNAVARAEQLYTMKQKLDIWDKSNKWSKDPNMDRLRRNAKNAIEELYDALESYVHTEERRLYDKLDESDSDQVINWKNLLKKLGHP